MISVGICAYNEAGNIGKLLTKLAHYDFEIIVVASGCTDKTVEIARQHRCKVLVQEKREGKASAINLFLKEAVGDIIILQSADTLPSDFTYKYLLAPFENSEVGMVGAHPVPTNSLRKVEGQLAHILWGLHHCQALASPKAGEVIAFRNVVGSIPKDTSVDEAAIEEQIIGLGYKLVYAPDAVIYNHGAETVSDFRKQRIRIYKGHLSLKSRKVSTMGTIHLPLAKATLGYLVKYPKAMLTYVSNELDCRKQAKKLKEQTVWEISETTKELK